MTRTQNCLVLHVLAALDFGGVESHMRLIAANAAQSKWKHAFCALGPGGSVLQELRAIGAQADALECRVTIPSFAAIHRLWRHLRFVRPDVVHLHGAEANFHGTIAARLAGVPVVIAEEIGIPRHSRTARRVFGWIYRRCDQVVAISRAVKDSMIALGEARPESIVVVYNPFDPQPFRSYPQREGRIVLGFVGRLEAVKNPAAAVEAVAILRNRGHNLFLRIVGEGSLRPELEDRVNVLGLSDHVELTGFQPRPFELLQDCHFYLQPSLTEGFGLAICEAMSAGIPVIASAVGGAPEIIDHGRTGWLLRLPDIPTLVDAIETAIKLDDATLTTVRHQAKTAVRQRFGVQGYLERCDNLYDHLIAHKGGGEREDAGC